jgi:tRNA-dihydrouridine synthase A
LSVAPMMDYTDRHCRVVLRALTRETLLYSEMITAQAIVLGGRVDFLRKDPVEHPVALQLGGDDPRMLARAAKIAEDLGWDEVNLNVGCPSDRVQRGRFGACLMAVPEVVAECVSAMRAAVSIPVTVKHRIGIDDRDAYEDMLAFVDVVAQAGADRFSVHARKAWLNGLSPRENRTIPPLRYDEVHRLKREHPELAIEINGGIKTMAEAKLQLEHVDAVMIGRAACDDPWVFAEADTRIFGAAANPAQTRSEAALAVVPYLAREVANGTKPHAVTRHLLGLFAKTPLAKAWKHGIASIGQMKDAEAQRAPAALEALALAASRPREERLASQASTRG